MKQSNWTGSAESRGYGAKWKRLRKAVIIRDEGFCVNCRGGGHLIHGNQCDHIIPKADGGTDDIDNLQLLCIPCHDAKSLTDRGYAPSTKTTSSLDGTPTDPDHPWFNT